MGSMIDMISSHTGCSGCNAATHHQPHRLPHLAAGHGHCAMGAKDVGHKPHHRLADSLGGRSRQRAQKKATMVAQVTLVSAVCPSPCAVWTAPFPQTRSVLPTTCTFNGAPGNSASDSDPSSPPPGGAPDGMAPPPPPRAPLLIAGPAAAAGWPVLPSSPPSGVGSQGLGPFALRPPLALAAAPVLDGSPPPRLAASSPHPAAPKSASTTRV